MPLASITRTPLVSQDANVWSTIAPSYTFAKFNAIVLQLSPISAVTRSLLLFTTR